MSAGDRVVLIAPHPWASYSGVIVGSWPGRECDWLVALDNGTNVGANSGRASRACLGSGCPANPRKEQTVSAAMEQKLVVTFYADRETALAFMEYLRIAAEAFAAPRSSDAASALFTLGDEAVVRAAAS